MRHTAIPACVISLIAQLGLATVAAAQGGADRPEVRTTATATRNVQADHAALTLSFTAEDSTPALAGHRLAVRADSVRQVLTAMGIPSESLITASRWSWGSDRIVPFARPRCLTPAPQGRTCQQAVDTTWGANGRWTSARPVFDTLYRARETIDVHVGHPTLVGAVIDSALARWITEISNIRFRASDVRQAQMEALQEASTRAREQAEAMAAATGGRLGRVLSLSTADDRGSYGREIGLEGVTVTSGGSTQVTAPLVPVSVTVYGRWEYLRR